MHARTAHWWIAGLSITAYFSLLFLFAANVPIEDDYDSIFGFYSQWDMSRTLGSKVQLLVSQHNEHRMLFNRVVYLLERQVAGGTDLRRLIFIGNLAWLVLFLLLLSIFRGNPAFPSAVALFSIFLFVPTAHESMFWAMVALQNHYVIVFALLSFILVSRTWYLSAAFFACLSLYTQGNGLLALLIATGWIAWQMIQGNGSRYTATAAVFACAGATGLYFADYVHPAHHPVLGESITHPLDTGRFCLAVIGSGVGYMGLGTAIAAGGGLSCLFAYLTYRRYFLTQPIMYAFMLFLFGGAAMLAAGRSGFGAEYALSPRYAVTSNCLLACVAVGALSLVDRQRRGLSRGVRIAVIALALAHGCAAYATTFTTIRERRDSLLQGAAAFVSHRSTAGLYYPQYLKAGELMQFMLDHGYYHLPTLPDAPPLVAHIDLPQRTIVFKFVRISPADYHGDRMISRVNGAVLISNDSGSIHLKGWMDIAGEDPEAVIFVAAPVPPTSASGTEVDPEVAARESSLAAPHDRSFEIVMTFPPETDLSALSQDMCVAYRTIGTPLTLFKGNLPFCEERLVAAGSN